MFEFLENYRDVTVPAPEMDGVVLTCQLGSGVPRDDIPDGLPGQLRELWLSTSGGPLMVDEQFGICGLMLHSPVEARQRASDRANVGYGISESDWVLGEFVGDSTAYVDRFTSVRTITKVSRPSWKSESRRSPTNSATHPCAETRGIANQIPCRCRSETPSLPRRRCGRTRSGRWG